MSTQQNSPPYDLEQFATALGQAFANYYHGEMLVDIGKGIIIALIVFVLLALYIALFRD